MLIALTGWGQEQDKQAARAAGFDDHLTKPVDPDDVERVLGELLCADARAQRRRPAGLDAQRLNRPAVAESALPTRAPPDPRESPICPRHH